MSERIDVHQHLWPAALVTALRARTEAPYLDGWRLHLPGETPYDVRPDDHDVQARRDRESDQAVVAVALSAGLGIHDLKPDEAAPLLEAWHDGAAELPGPFRAWAATTYLDPDLDALADRLRSGFVGVEVSANWLATPALLDEVRPTLELCQALNRPVLVHPGPVGLSVAERFAHVEQGWWAPVVSYTAQLQAAWWAWRARGRQLFPDLRVCFVACAGLGPVQHERYLARGGVSGPIDANAFVDTSSYGPQGIDAVVRALGIDVVVLGSDRPYAEPSSLPGGPAAERAITVTNPYRLLNGALK